jgi:ABC-type transport system substrate-binding protein
MSAIEKAKRLLESSGYAVVKSDRVRTIAQDVNLLRIDPGYREVVQENVAGVIAQALYRAGAFAIKDRLSADPHTYDLSAEVALTVILPEAT